ncbi:MAG: F0F1 ATP synthase subunit A [Deltaproteobacteria bacterium]|nr:F0F1 ATP synthase subunit A [Deltaproteobacteria bacterium]
MESHGAQGHWVLTLGPLEIGWEVLTTWLIMALLGLGSWLLTRRFTDDPGRLQTMTEGIISVIEGAIEAVLPGHTWRVLPFVGTLWIFLTVANLIGLVPGLDSPTTEISVTGALAILVFMSVHWFGIRSEGLWGYLKHYVSPSPLLLPFHIIGEITRTLALAVRLFGNIMSMENAALIILMVMGFLAPIPILMLHIIEALVQTYIFGMLALIFIAGAISSQGKPSSRREP